MGGQAMNNHSEDIPQEKSGRVLSRVFASIYEFGEHKWTMIG